MTLTKHDDFQGAKQLRVDEFVIRHYQFIKGRSRVFGDELHKAQSSIVHNKKKNARKNAGEERLEDYRSSQEQWNKKTFTRISNHNSVGQFRKPPTIKRIEEQSRLMEL